MTLSDEGLNGLHLHVLNETDAPLHGLLRLTCVKDGTHIVRACERPVTILSRGTESHCSSALLSGFFDITYAYRFGPRPHDVTVATLIDRDDNSVIAEAVHFPAGPTAPYAMAPRDLGLEVMTERVGASWQLRVRTRAFAQFLHIDDPHFIAEDNWLHLPPNQERCIPLRARSNPDALPSGEVRALNSDRTLRYAGSA